MGIAVQPKEFVPLLLPSTTTTSSPPTTTSPPLVAEGRMVVTAITTSKAPLSSTTVYGKGGSAVASMITWPLLTLAIAAIGISVGMVVRRRIAKHEPCSTPDEVVGTVGP